MIITFSGPSTIGKDSTWIRITEELGFLKVVPYTTREKRANEIIGDDYHFLTINECQEKIRTNQFLEWDYFNSNYYATGIEVIELEKNHNLVFHELARKALRIKRSMPKVKAVMLLFSNEKILLERLYERGYDEDEIKIRYNHYLEERTHSPLFDFVIPNAELLTDFEARLIVSKIFESF